MQSHGQQPGRQTREKALDDNSMGRHDAKTSFKFLTKSFIGRGKDTELMAGEGVEIRKPLESSPSQAR